MSCGNNKLSNPPNAEYSNDVLYNYGLLKLTDYFDNSTCTESGTCVIKDVATDAAPTTVIMSSSYSMSHGYIDFRSNGYPGAGSATTDVYLDCSNLGKSNHF